MALTDDEFVKNGKLEGYQEMMEKLHEEEVQTYSQEYTFEFEEEEEE